MHRQITALKSIHHLLKLVVQYIHGKQCSTLQLHVNSNSNKHPSNQLHQLACITDHWHESAQDVYENLDLLVHVIVHSELTTNVQGMRTNQQHSELTTSHHGIVIIFLATAGHWRVGGSLAGWRRPVESGELLLESAGGEGRGGEGRAHRWQGSRKK
jgi:hypothetical protein